MTKKAKLRGSILLALCVCGTFATQSVCNAAEAESAELPSYDLGETVVTATKTKLAEKKVPMSTTVITEKQIKESGVSNLRDLLKTATGLDVMQASMTGNKVSIRGMSTNHALILVDGKRTAGEDTSATMNVYGLTRINLQDVERVEIIRGAGSSLYGSDAMSGVINIITKKNKPAGGTVGAFTGGREMGQYGSYSTGDIGKLNLNFAYNITKVRPLIEKNYLNQETSNMYGPRRFFNIHGDYRFTENTGLEFDGSFMKEQLASGINGSGTMEWYDNNRSDFSLNYYGVSGKNDYNLRTYYSRLGKESRAISSHAWNDFDHMKYDTLVVEAKNSMHMDDKNTLTYGAEWQKQSVRSTRMGAGADNPFTESYLGLTKAGSEKDVKTYAGYIQDEWQLTDKLFLVPSVRYDHHDSFGGEVSPKLGATYEVSDNFRVKANYGKGYKAPTIYELYSRMDRTMGRMRVQVLGNPDLKPEDSRNFDIGIEGELGKATGKLSYFHNKVENLITTKSLGITITPTGPIYKNVYENVDEAQMKGLEAEFGYKFDDNWSFKTNYMHLNATDQSTGARLTGRAKNTGVVSLTYTDAKENPLTATLSNQWYLNYLADTDYNVTYGVTDFVVSKDFSKKFRAYAGIDNIFDKRFTTDATRSFDLYGRTWKLGMEMSF